MDNVQSNAIEIIDRNGWSKRYLLPPKPIIHLGSNIENDIILTGAHGTGVAPLHAQIIAPGGNRAGYQLVNLSETEIILNAPEIETLPSRTAMVVIGGSSFTMGDFTLVFHGGGGYFGGPIGRRTPNIGLQLQLSHMQVGPGQAFDATVLIQNLGQKTGVQFDLELEGLDDNCFDLEPGPLLSSGAGKEMKLRIFHRGPVPVAGDCQIMLRAAAPRSYPGELVAVTQTIEILPYYRHRLGLLRPGGSGKAPQVDSEELLPKAKAVLPPQQSAAPIPYQAGGAEWLGASAPGQTADIAPSPATPVEESANWWSAPAEPTQQKDSPAGVGVGVVAATAAAPTETDSTDWWSAPQETPSDTQTQTQAGAEPPAAQTEAQSETADWWNAPTPAGETAPATSPIPPGTGVPRQADDWWDAETAGKQPAQSAAPAATHTGSAAAIGWAAPPDSGTTQAAGSAETPASDSAEAWHDEPATAELPLQSDTAPPAQTASDTDDWWAAPPDNETTLVAGSAETPTSDSAEAWRGEPETEPPQSGAASSAQFETASGVLGVASTDSSAMQVTDSAPAPAATPPDEWWATGPAPAPAVPKIEEGAEPPADKTTYPVTETAPLSQDVEETSANIDAQAREGLSTAAATAAITAATMPPDSASQPAAEIQPQPVPPPQPEVPAKASLPAPEPVRPAGDETLVSAAPPSIVPEAVSQSTPTPEPPPPAPAPAEPQVQTTAPPSVPKAGEAKTGKSGGLWSTMKAGVVGMAVALPFVGRKITPKDDEPAPQAEPQTPPPTGIEDDTLPQAAPLPITDEPSPHAPGTPEEYGVSNPDAVAGLRPGHLSRRGQETGPRVTPPPHVPEEPSVATGPQQDDAATESQDTWWADDDAWATTPTPSPVEQPTEAGAAAQTSRPSLESKGMPAPAESEPPEIENAAKPAPAADDWWSAGSSAGALHPDEETTDTWGQKDAWPPLVPGAETASSAEDWWSAEPEPPSKSEDDKQSPPTGKA